MEAIVNFLHILGPTNIFYHVFIEIELNPTIFKLYYTYQLKYNFGNLQYEIKWETVGGLQYFDQK